MEPPAVSIRLALADEAEMNRLGARIAPSLRAGDVLLLEGPIGAGKTHLARAIITARLARPEDVPSPTYTLVQTYEAGGVEVWHADLYRLGDSSELVELGLDEAFGTAIVIVEWPDRLPAEMVPQDALRIGIEPLGDARRLTISSNAVRWAGLFPETAHG